nr:hypothetical protein JVH1_9236 [Rhodococcus sp. JVH1]
MRLFEHIRRDARCEDLSIGAPRMAGRRPSPALLCAAIVDSVSGH